MPRSFAVAVAAGMLCASLASAANLTFSIGIRETGTVAPIGGDGGTANGIEFIDLDAHVVPLDGNWHQVSINLGSPQSVTAFAGGTANGVIDGNRGTLELIRVRNTDGITTPITLYFDDLVYTDPAGGPTLIAWEGHTLGSEVVLRSPNFSGSTDANLVDALNVAVVTDEIAFGGMQSYRTEFQFVDSDSSRWVRFTTNNTPNLPNPTIEFDGVLSFYVNGTTVPEPAAASLLGLAVLGGVLVRRRS